MPVDKQEWVAVLPKLGGAPTWTLGAQGGRSEIFDGIGRALSHFGAMRVRTPAIGES